MGATVIQADACRLPLADASVDAVVTDPPYALTFMGREWDSFSPVSYQRWCQVWAAECLRVLKPGGHLFAFGGTRTYHRLTCAVEDAGFEIRDTIAWIHAQGFPKSLNLGDGRGTALKPGHEPIVVARKPLAGTVAGNVLAYGTGALNIDGCRVNPGEPVAGGGGWAAHKAETEGWDRPYTNGVEKTQPHTAGRWPANVALDEAAAAELDQQSGNRPSTGTPTRAPRPGKGTTGGYGGALGLDTQGPLYSDEGGASRFFPVFRYAAKADTAERPRVGGVSHETVKPLDFMRWLVRLVTPPGGLVLDPFAGSGTTAEACLIEGFDCVTLELDAKYLPLIRARLGKPIQPVLIM
jgi:hypothetical protein